jgi:hypothetical protein
MSKRPAEWEYDFSPNPITTRCDHRPCGQVHIADASVIAVRHIGRGTLQLHFCSRFCEQQYYIAHLRRSEGDVQPR